MRYYDIVLSDPDTGAIWRVTPSGFDRVSTSLLNGAPTTFSSRVASNSPLAVGGFMNDPGALNVEFDVLAYPYHTPQGASKLRVWGIPIQALSQAVDLAGARLQLRAGMSAGLPLAKPQQSGLLIDGQVYQAFGNWQGVNQTLDLIVMPGGTEPELGYCLYWPAGQTLSAALATTFTQAMPDYKQDIRVDSRLVLPNDEPGVYENLEQFGGWLLQFTQAVGAQLFGDDSKYPGVSITVTGKTVHAFDWTAPPPVLQLAFEDLIGQPTWITPGALTFKTVLRADLQVGNWIKFPPGIAAPFALTSAAAAAPGSPARNRSTFQGSFWIQEVHHFANFRQPDADSWNTTFVAVALPPPAALTEVQVTAKRL